MSAGNEKKTPKNLRVGDFILITRRSDGLLKVAGAKRNSIIARLTSPPKRVPNPDRAGKRGGYSLATDEGVVTFVASVASVILASAEERRRIERERAARSAAVADSESVLAGVGRKAADARPAATEPAKTAAEQAQPSAKQSERSPGEWLAPTRDMRTAARDSTPATAPSAPRPTPANVPPRKVAAAAPAAPAKAVRTRPADNPGRQGDADQWKPAVGPVAAANYAALSASCTSQAGRDYWTRLAMAAQGEPG